jgi:hypothetical protein
MDKLLEDIKRIEFEEIDYSLENDDYFQYRKGKIPILISAPHGTRHLRNDDWLDEDEYTASIAIKLAELTGAHVIYANRATKEDPNHDLKCSYKNAVKQIKKKHGIKFLADIHGASEEKEFIVDVGIIDDKDMKKCSCPNFMSTIEKSLQEIKKRQKGRLFNIMFSGAGDESKGVERVTSFAKNRGDIEAAQFEINAKYRIIERKPDSSEAMRGNDPHFKTDEKNILELIEVMRNMILEINRKIQEMDNEKRDAYSQILEAFDQLKLDNVHERRMASKPLYDFFMILLKEVGVALCGLDENSLKAYHLKTRWKNIKTHLSYIEDPKVWDDLVNELNNIRNDVEHKDYYYPKAQRLKEIREKALEFKDWIVRVGKEYYRQSKNFTFKEAFLKTVMEHVREADWMMHEFGESTPHAAKSEYSLLDEKDEYLELKQSIKLLQGRLNNIADLEDLERPDLENLIKMVRIISQIRAREEILLKYSVCPKCGGKITETQRAVGGTADDPEPTAIVYRVGCENCDYELHSETISL